MVSIIMPVFNADPYLEDCLQSIINQSFEDWELIAIDDFSTDHSLDILQSFAHMDKRIHCFSNTDKGIVPALNLAFSKIQYPYITRMDADDLMPHNKLEVLLKKSVESPGSCITAKVQYIRNDHLQDGFIQYEKWLNLLIDNHSHYCEIYKECVVPSPCWMLHRDTILKIGGITDNTYPEDYDLIFRLYQHNIPIVGIDQVLHFWRDHSERASRTDSNYTDQGFYPLKVKYFKRIDYKSNQQTFLWGAGTAGKLVAKELIKNDIEFDWVTKNDKKTGKHIYDILIKDLEILDHLTDCQIIIAIKQSDFKKTNKKLFEKLESKSNELFFFH